VATELPRSSALRNETQANRLAVEGPAGPDRTLRDRHRKAVEHSNRDRVNLPYRCHDEAFMPKTDADRLLQVTQALVDEVSRDHPISYAMVFAAIGAAEDGRVDQGELQGQVGFSNPSMQRALRALLALGLIEKTLNLEHQHKRWLALSDHGRRVLGKITQKLK
jgi:DNA-binding MarR family transcriptional regulator